jgi:hypothetical protein
MRIEIEKPIDAENAEIWAFNLIGLTVVFTGWYKQTKPKGKRKWNTIQVWDKYRNNSVKEPHLPLGIRAEALDKACSFIKVKTWNEWKQNTP